MSWTRQVQVRVKGGMRLVGGYVSRSSERYGSALIKAPPPRFRGLMGLFIHKKGL